MQLNNQTVEEAVYINNSLIEISTEKPKPIILTTYDEKIFNQKKYYFRLLITQFLVKPNVLAKKL